MALVVVTIGVVAWVAIPRSDPRPTGDFVGTEQRFVASALEVLAGAEQIVDTTDLKAWNVVVQEGLTAMGEDVARLERLRRASEGEARRVATAAVSTATSIVDLIVEYQAEVGSGTLTTATSAADAIKELIAELDADARTWKKLQGA